MLEIKNLYKNFGSLDVLKGIDLAVKDGEVVAIIGPSGTGKSTLLRCNNLLEKPEKGVQRAGNPVYLPFEEGADVPRFREQVKNPQIDKMGFVLYYTEQCPFTAKYVPLIEKMAADKAIPFETILLETAEQAQAAPAAVTSYCLFYDGKFLTNEILSEKKFEKMAKRRA